MRDLLLPRRQRQAPEEIFDDLDRHLRQIADVAIADRHRQGLGLEPRALTARTDRRRHEFFDLFLYIIARSLGVATLQVVDHAFERGAVLPRLAAARGVGERLFLIGAVENEVDDFVGELLDWCRRLDAIAPQHALELLHVIWVHRRVAPATERAAPRNDRAFRDRLAVIRNHFPRIDLDLFAKSGADGARTVRRVEREEPRRQLLEREPAVDARKRLAVG